MSEFTRPPRIVIAGGGTGGHVLPAVAVLEELARRAEPVELQWIGSASGLEREEAEARGIAFVIIQAGKFRRYASLHTIPDAARIPIGTIQARKAVRQFRPDVVFSTGGFVSVPTVIAAWRLAPVITHEQTATIGLANRINSRFSRVMALSFPETASRSRLTSDRSIVTGNPVRASILDGQPDRVYDHFALDPALPLLFVTGGARGSSPLNVRVEGVLSQLLDLTQIIHQTGPKEANSDYLRLVALRDALTPERQQRYRIIEYIRDEMSDIFAASSLVLCRSGAGMVAELAVLGKPSILIPLPGSGGGEQQLNAKVLGDVGGAVVLEQAEATPDRLLREVRHLLETPGKLDSMRTRALSVASPDAARHLTDVILELVKESRRSRGQPL
ncbi:MAG: undecaprenyldiphospho-muramoylpentapeptide beta-N-acetylglucosaminyltransferase [Thermomicrobiales bacterium]